MYLATLVASFCPTCTHLITPWSWLQKLSLVMFHFCNCSKRWKARKNTFVQNPTDLIALATVSAEKMWRNEPKLRRRALYNYLYIICCCCFLCCCWYVPVPILSFVFSMQFAWQLNDRSCLATLLMALYNRYAGQCYTYSIPLVSGCASGLLPCHFHCSAHCSILPSLLC